MRNALWAFEVILGRFTLKVLQQHECCNTFYIANTVNIGNGICFEEAVTQSC